MNDIRNLPGLPQPPARRTRRGAEALPCARRLPEKGGLTHQAILKLPKLGQSSRGTGVRRSRRGGTGNHKASRITENRLSVLGSQFVPKE